MTDNSSNAKTDSHTQTVSHLTLQKALSLFSPFNDLDPTYITKLIEHVEIVAEPKGKLLFKRGKAHSHRYYLISGCVDLISANFDKQQLVAGEPRAERPLNELSPSQVSAVVVEPSQLLRVEADFLDLAMFWNQSAATQKDEHQKEDVPLDEDQMTPGLGGLALTAAKYEESEDQTDWMSALIASPLFTQVPPAHIQQLFTRFERIACPAGKDIIKEGESGDYFYVIHQGRVRVTNLTGQLDVELHPGQFFGEEALVADTPRNATVSMMTDGVLMRLQKSDFVSLLHDPVQKKLTIEAFQVEPEEYQVIDIRLPIEYRGVHVPQSRNIPLSVLRARLPELKTGERYAVTDDGGRRSHLAAYLLCQAGLETYILEESDSLYENRL